jgi:hypothetical protein
MWHRINKNPFHKYSCINWSSAVAKSANKGKKGSAGGKQSKQNQGNATAKKAKNGGKKK